MFGLLTVYALLACQTLNADQLMDMIWRHDLKRLDRVLMERPSLALAKNESGQTIVNIAAIESPQALKKVLSAAGPEGVRIGNRHGQTALYWAAMEGKADSVRILLDAGADPNDSDDEGATPLHRAVGNGREGVIRLLLAAGANISCRDKRGAAPINWAAASIKDINLLVEMGANINSATYDGGTLATFWWPHRMVKGPKEGVPNFYRSLYRLGLNVNVRCRDGLTPLMHAVQDGWFDLVKALVDCGARVDLLAPDGRKVEDFLVDIQDQKTRNQIGKFLLGSHLRTVQP